MPPGFPNEYVQELNDAQITRRDYRTLVGGLWAEVGRLQFEFLAGLGLQPSDRLLDVGCGALRGGVHFMRYLEPGNYYGIDRNASLIRAGVEIEMPEAQVSDRRPQLLVDDGFGFDRFPVKFRWAIAQSVFTHLPSTDIQLCLVRISEALEVGGRFFATYFPAPERHALGPVRHRGGATTFLAADPYHQHFTLYQYLVQGLPLSVRNVGDWNHPRGQHMLEFVRLPETRSGGLGS